MRWVLKEQLLRRFMISTVDVWLPLNPTLPIESTRNSNFLSQIYYKETRRSTPQIQRNLAHHLLSHPHYPILLILLLAPRFLGALSPFVKDTIALKTTLTFVADALEAGSACWERNNDWAVSARNPSVMPASQESFAHAQGCLGRSSALSAETDVELV
ncbi:hypothetical protein KC340_g66 [Hortaea werneckii]|nr:hypothetical protein KC340_g66 [Hortaea werneckii]